MLSGALDLKHKNVQTCMTALNSVFMLEINAILDKDTLTQVDDTVYP